VLLLYIHRGAAYSINSWIPWHSVLFGSFSFRFLFIVEDPRHLPYRCPCLVSVWRDSGQYPLRGASLPALAKQPDPRAILALLSVCSGAVDLQGFRNARLGSRRESFLCGLARVGTPSLQVFLSTVSSKLTQSVHIQRFLSWVVAGVHCTLVILALTLATRCGCSLAVSRCFFPTLITSEPAFISLAGKTFHPFWRYVLSRCTS